jgi:hypothetical protein
MNFEDACNEVVASVENVYKSTVKIVCAKIIMDTPVDTGDLRGSWTTSLGESKLTQIPRNDGSGEIPISENQSVVDSWDILSPQDLFMSNGLPYSEKIENTTKDQKEWLG